VYDFIQLDNFTGGITDNPTVGRLDKAEKYENLMPTDSGGLEVRAGSDFYHATVNRTINGEPVNKFMELWGDFIIASGRSLYNIDPPTNESIIGPTGNRAFDAGNSGWTHYDYALWKEHLFIVNDYYSIPIKVWYNGTNYSLVNSGMPKLASDPTVTAGGAGANSYIYAFLYYYTYTVNTVTFEDFGAVTQVLVTGADSPDSSAITLADIPIVTNGTTGNYDTANMKVYIYRTITGGSSFYLNQTIDNGVTSTTDNMSDVTLLTQPELYINGGILDNDPPPKAKYIEIIDNIAYYANVYTDGEYMKFRVLQSKANDPDSVPAANYIDIDGEITGISSINTIPIVFTETKTYRLDGIYDEFGDGYIRATVINDGVGCISNDSIQKGGNGIYFAGNIGFCFTDGREVIKISEDFNNTYKSITLDDVYKGYIHSAYDKTNQRMYWTANRGTHDYADSIFVFHERYGIKPEGVFTVWSNGSSFRPSAIFFDDSGMMIRGDSTGYFFRHHKYYRNDPLYKIGVEPADWDKKAIIWDYVSSHLDGGNKKVRKWGTKCAVRCKNISNLSIQPYTANDGYQNWGTMQVIRRRDQADWDVERYIDWEDPAARALYWENTQDINEIRYFPQGKLRFFTKQFRLTNAFVVVQKSDDTLTCATDGTAKTFTIAGPDPDIWLDYCVGHVMYIEDDDYTLGWEITGRTDTVLTVADPRGDLPTGADKKWIMKGYPKDEMMELLSCTIYFNNFNENLKPFAVADLGANAA
jgi:hypothetical protein